MPVKYLAADPADELLASMSSLAVGQTGDRAEPAADARKPTVHVTSSEDGTHPTPPPDATDLPPSWVVAWSEKRQRWYYFDKKTARTQWHRPEVLQIE